MEEVSADDKARDAKRADEMARRNYCRTFGHGYVLTQDLTAVVCDNRCGMVALTGRAGVDLVQKMWPGLFVMEVGAEDALTRLRTAFPDFAIIPKTQVPAKPTLFVPPNASGR